MHLVSSPASTAGRPSLTVPAPQLPAISWVAAVHPDPEVAQARAGLASAATGVGTPLAASTAYELITQLAGAAGDGVVFVHVDALERFRAGWAGHRLIVRLRAAGHDDVLAWVTPGDREAAALAVRSGASGLVHLPAPAVAASHERVRALQRAVLQPSLREPATAGCAGLLEEWFAARYGVAWQAWMEPAAALLAGGGERGEQAELLRARLDPATNDHALRRLRQLGEILGGEIRGNEVVLRRESLAVLARIGRTRPIDAEPLLIRSLQRAAAALQRSPELAIEAGLAPESSRDLLAVAAAEREMLGRAVGRRGRPEAGAWRMRRNRALARVAERRGGTAAEKLALVRLLGRRVEGAIDAVHDALDDRERVGPLC